MSLNSPCDFRKVVTQVTVVIFLISVLPSCSGNILETFSDTTTNEALFFDAKELIDKSNYTGALAKFTGMSPEYLAKREVMIVHASAYAGLCGVDFLTITQALANLGTTRIFVWLVATFTGGTASKQTNCILAEDKIKAIGALGANRTSDENLLMAFVGLSKMGAILSRFSDTTPANGIADPGFNPCAAGAIISSADAKEIATGFTITVNALSNIGSSTLGSAVVTAVTAVCADLGAPFNSLCGSPAQVLTTDIDANEERAIRSIINESEDMGLGTNCTGNAATCNCP